MTNHVITSKNPNLKIGEIYRGLAEGPFKYGSLPSQCFRVVGKATEQDWIDCNVSYGAPRDHTEMLVRVDEPWYYYWIQTD